MQSEVLDSSKTNGVYNNIVNTTEATYRSSNDILKFIVISTTTEGVPQADLNGKVSLYENEIK